MQISLSQDEVKSLINANYNVIPVWTEILADMETPVSCYIKAKSYFQQIQKVASPSFLLESVEGGEKVGRFSIIGLNPAGIISVQNGSTSLRPLWEDLALPSIGQDQKDPFESLSQLLDKLKSSTNLSNNSAEALVWPNAGLVGALSYDSVRFIEKIEQLKVDRNFPESIFLLTGDLIIFDNLTKSLKLVTNIYAYSEDETQSSKLDLNILYEKAIQRINNLKILLESELSSQEKRIIPQIVAQANNKSSQKDNIETWESSLTKSKFIEIVEEAKERIRSGDIFQIVLSQQLKKQLTNSQSEFDSLYLYRVLRNLNPSPYLFLLDFIDFQLIGSSPEVMVKTDFYIDGSRKALLRPIAGTYRRGKSDAEDQKLAESLKKDEKELAEHLMLIDLARNDLGRVAIPGTVQLTDLMIVEKYSHVLHLVSEVECKLKSEVNSIDLLKATFPAGTLSGAPKVKAMEIIASLEPVARGFYGGCVGYLGFDGSVNTAMTIRTLLAKDGEIRLQVGAGIVYDSDPAKEYQETLNKGAALLRVVEAIS